MGGTHSWLFSSQSMKKVISVLLYHYRWSFISFHYVSFLRLLKQNLFSCKHICLLEPMNIKHTWIWMSWVLFLSYHLKLCHHKLKFVSFSLRFSAILIMLKENWVHIILIIFSSKAAVWFISHLTTQQAFCVGTLRRCLYLSATLRKWMGIEMEKYLCTLFGGRLNY